MSWYDLLGTPLGPLFVGGSDAGLHRIDFLGERRTLDDELALLERDGGGPAERDPEAARPAAAALAAWFADAARWPDLPLAPRGTGFQLRVWERLRAIPSGETASYGGIAEEIGRPRAARAVGGAVGRNPLSIVVPCHRVLAAGGALGGYASGLDRKRWLLAHEGAALPAAQPQRPPPRAATPRRAGSSVSAAISKSGSTPKAGTSGFGRSAVRSPARRAPKTSSRGRSPT